MRSADMMVSSGWARSRPRPLDASPWRPFCSLLQGIAAYLRGHHDDAELLLDEGIRLSGNGVPAVRSLCLAERAMIAIEREDWELAGEWSDAALKIVEECKLTAEP